MNYFKLKFNNFIVKVTLILITISFIFGSIISCISKKKQKYLAIVNNHYITEKKVLDIYNYKYLKKQILLNYKFSQIFNNKSYIKQIHLEILSQLINEIIIKNYINKLNYKIENDLLQQTILKMPVFQKNNIFDKKKYLHILKNINITPLKYEILLNNKLTINTLLKNIKKNQFTLNNKISFLKKTIFQKRIINKINIPIQNILLKQKITKQEIIKYYTNNSNKFFKPEYFKIAFIKINRDKLDSCNDLKIIKNWYNINILHNKKITIKKHHIFTIINTILKQRKKLIIYHNIQKKINKKIYINNVTLYAIQKQLRCPIFVTNWFTKENIPYELNSNATKSVLFSKKITSNSNDLKNYLKQFTINNNSCLIIKIIGHKNKISKSMLESRNEILHKIQFIKAKKQAVAKAQKILVAFQRKDKKFLKTLGAYFHEDKVTLKYNYDPIVYLTFLLPKPQLHAFTFNFFNNFKGDCTLLILSKINKLNTYNFTETIINAGMLHKNNTLNKIYNKLYTKSYIIYNRKNSTI